MTPRGEWRGEKWLGTHGGAWDNCCCCYCWTGAAGNPCCAGCRWYSVINSRLVVTLVSRTISPPRSIHTHTKRRVRETFLPYQMRRDIISFCHPYRFSKGIGALARISRCSTIDLSAKTKADFVQSWAKSIYNLKFTFRKSGDIRCAQRNSLLD